MGGGLAQAVWMRKGTILFQAMGWKEQKEDGENAQRPDLGRDAQHSGFTTSRSYTADSSHVEFSYKVEYGTDVLAHLFLGQQVEPDLQELDTAACR